MPVKVPFAANDIPFGNEPDIIVCVTVSPSASVAATEVKLLKFDCPFSTLPIFVSAAVANTGLIFTSIADANFPARPEPFVTTTS